MKTSISIETVDGSTGQKKQRSVTDINPSATSEELKTFAQGLVGLTTQNYSSTNRIQVVNVDTESVQGKIVPTLNYSSQSESIGNNQYRVPFTYTGDGELSIFYDAQNQPTIQSVTISKSTGYITVTKTEGSGAVLFSTYCMARETDNYYSCAIVRSIAIGE